MSTKPHALRFFIPLAAFIVVGVLLGIGIYHSRDIHTIKSPLIGKAAPAWSLPVLGHPGQTFGSKELKGHWYVLNVWGTWCYVCHQEHPELLAIARQNSVPIIGIDWMDDDADASAYLAKNGDPYALVTTDPNGQVAVNWGVYGAPETFLVNPAGVVVYKQIGAMTPQVWQKEFASRLPPRPADRSS